MRTLKEIVSNLQTAIEESFAEDKTINKYLNEYVIIPTTNNH